MRRTLLIPGVLLLAAAGALGILWWTQRQSPAAPANSSATNQSVTASSTLETDAGNGFVTRQENNAVVLYRVNGSRRERTGLTLSIPKVGDVVVPPTVKVAPGGTRVAVAMWVPQRAKVTISTAELSGNALAEIAQQEAPEGQGSLVAETLVWSEDGAFLTYDEQFVLRSEGGEQVTIRTITYRVDAATGGKTVANTYTTTVDE